MLVVEAVQLSSTEQTGGGEEGWTESTPKAWWAGHSCGGQTFVISWVGFDYNYTCVVTCSSSPERNGSVIVRHENDVICVTSYRLTFQMTKFSTNRD